MMFVAMIAVLAAVAPAQEVVEEVETQEIAFSEDCESLVYTDSDCLEEEIVFEDAVDSIVEDAIAFDEE